MSCAPKVTPVLTMKAAAMPIATGVSIATLPCRAARQAPAKKGPQELARARAGHDIGLLSEAGLPAVADPGSALVKAAHQAGIEVVPFSGPTSLLLALAASGLHGQSFAFTGYLPTEAAQRAQRIKDLETASRRLHQTQLAIETPYRNAALWDALVQQLQPTTQLSVACGLTLPGGFVRTATVAHWRQQRLSLPDKVPAVFCWLAA